MIKLKTKLLAGLLSFAMVACVGAIVTTLIDNNSTEQTIVAHADTCREGDIATWSVGSVMIHVHTDNTLHFMGTGAISDYSIASKAPWYNTYYSKVTSVVFDEGITRIGNYALHNFTKITSVSWPDSLKSVGNYAFNSCSALTKVSLPAGMKAIGDHAFNGTGINTLEIAGPFAADAQIHASAFTQINKGGWVSLVIPEEYQSQMGFTSGQNWYGSAKFKMPSGNFDFRNGSAIKEGLNMSADEFNSPVFGDYTFVGWATEVDGVDTLVDKKKGNNATAYETSDFADKTATYYAIWQNASEHYVRTTALDLHDTDSFDNSQTFGIKWDKATKTLTLDNASIEANAYVVGYENIPTVVYLPQAALVGGVASEATISLIGNSTIGSTSTFKNNTQTATTVTVISSIGLIINNANANDTAENTSLSIYLPDTNGLVVAAGIYDSYSNWNVDVNNVTLNVAPKTVDAPYHHVYGIWEKGAFTTGKNAVVNVTLDVESHTNAAYAFYLDGGRLINRGQMNLTLSCNTSGDTQSCGIYGNDTKTNSVSNDQFGTATSKISIKGTGLGIYNATVSVTVGSIVVDCITNAFVVIKEPIVVNFGTATVKAGASKEAAVRYTSNYQSAVLSASYLVISNEPLFDLNGAEGEYTYADYLEGKIPTWKNYTFEGWSKGSKTTPYPAKTTIPTTSDSYGATFYAVWSHDGVRVLTQSITFKRNTFTQGHPDVYVDGEKFEINFFDTTFNRYGISYTTSTQATGIWETCITLDGATIEGTINAIGFDLTLILAESSVNTILAPKGIAVSSTYTMFTQGSSKSPSGGLVTIRGNGILNIEVEGFKFMEYNEGESNYDENYQFVATAIDSVRFELNLGKKGLLNIQLPQIPARPTENGLIDGLEYSVSKNYTIASIGIKATGNNPASPNVTINGNLTIETAQSVTEIIPTYKGSGSTSCFTFVQGIRSYQDVIINDGNVTVTAYQAIVVVIGTGGLTINGGTVYAEGYIYAYTCTKTSTDPAKMEINGGVATFVSNKYNKILYEALPISYVYSKLSSLVTTYTTGLDNVDGEYVLQNGEKVDNKYHFGYQFDDIKSITFYAVPMFNPMNGGDIAYDDSTAPTWTGHEFMGWSTSPIFGSATTTFNVGVTYYAMWKNSTTGNYVISVPMTLGQTISYAKADGTMNTMDFLKGMEESSQYLPFVNENMLNKYGITLKVDNKVAYYELNNVEVNIPKTFKMAGTTEVIGLTLENNQFTLNGTNTVEVNTTSIKYVLKVENPALYMANDATFTVQTKTTNGIAYYPGYAPQNKNAFKLYDKENSEYTFDSTQLGSLKYLKLDAFVGYNLAYNTTILATKPENPTFLTGYDYTFVQWADMPIGGKKVEEDDMVRGRVYYAMWQNANENYVLVGDIGLRNTFDDSYLATNDIGSYIKDITNLEDYGLGITYGTNKATIKLDGASIYGKLLVTVQAIDANFDLVFDLTNTSEITTGADYVLDYAVARNLVISFAGTGRLEMKADKKVINSTRAYVYNTETKAIVVTDANGTQTVQGDMTVLTSASKQKSVAYEFASLFNALLLKNNTIKAVADNTQAPENNGMTVTVGQETYTFTFYGWYTKEIGGEKIHDGSAFVGTNTKFEKGVTYYAHYAYQGTPVFMHTLYVACDSGIYYLDENYDSVALTSDVLSVYNIKFIKAEETVNNKTYIHSTLFMNGVTIYAFNGNDYQGIYADDPVDIIVTDANYIIANTGIYFDYPYENSFNGTGSLEMLTDNEAISGINNALDSDQYVATYYYDEDGVKTFNAKENNITEAYWQDHVILTFVPVFAPMDGNYITDSDAAVTFNEALYAGLTFDGWYTKSIGGEKKTDNFENGVVYYAQYTKNGQKVVTDYLDITADGVLAHRETGKFVDASVDFNSSTDETYFAINALTLPALTSEELAAYGMTYTPATATTQAKLTLNNTVLLAGVYTDSRKYAVKNGNLVLDDGDEPLTCTLNVTLEMVGNVETYGYILYPEYVNYALLSSVYYEINSTNTFDLNSTNLTIVGDANAVFSVFTGWKNCAFDTFGDSSVTINGALTVNLIGGDEESTGWHAFNDMDTVTIKGATVKIENFELAISATYDVTIENATLTIKNDPDESAIESADNITITNSTLTLTEMEASIETRRRVSSKIVAYNGNLVITESTIKAQTNSNLLRANLIQIDNSSIEATTGEYAIEATAVEIINGSIVKLATTEGYNAIIGQCALIITDSTIEVEGYAEGLSQFGAIPMAVRPDYDGEYALKIENSSVKVTNATNALRANQLVITDSDVLALGTESGIYANDATILGGFVEATNLSLEGNYSIGSEAIHAVFVDALVYDVLTENYVPVVDEMQGEQLESLHYVGAQDSSLKIYFKTLLEFANTFKAVNNGNQIIEGTTYTVAGPTLESNTPDYTFTFYRDGQEIDKPTTPGAYTVKVLVPANDLYHYGEKTYDFTISFASLAQQAQEGNNLVKIDAPNGIDFGTDLKVEVLTVENGETYESAVGTLNKDTENFNTFLDKVFGVYDISLIKNNVAVQPNGTIKIFLAIPEEILECNFRVYHVHNGEATLMNFEKEDGYAVVETDKLSEFIFVYERTSLIPWMVVLSLVIVLALAVIAWELYNINAKKKGTKGFLMLSAGVPIFYMPGHLEAVIALAVVAFVAIVAAVLIFFLVYKKAGKKVENVVENAEAVAAEQAAAAEAEQTELEKVALEVAKDWADDNGVILEGVNDENEEVQEQEVAVAVEPVVAEEENDEGLSLSKSFEIASELVADSVITKASIIDYLTQTFGDSVLCNGRDNLTQTGLPLADTHYTLKKKENGVEIDKKSCFVYVYENKGIILLLVKAPDSYMDGVKAEHAIVARSAFPKTRDRVTWYSIPVDNTWTAEAVYKLLHDLKCYNEDVNYVPAQKIEVVYDDGPQEEWVEESRVYLSENDLGIEEDEEGEYVIGVFFKQRKRKLYWFKHDGVDFARGEVANYLAIEGDMRDVVVAIPKIRKDMSGHEHDLKTLCKKN